jgi:hypothetical protein
MEAAIKPPVQLSAVAISKPRCLAPASKSFALS